MSCTATLLLFALSAPLPSRAIPQEHDHGSAAKQDKPGGEPKKEGEEKKAVPDIRVLARVVDVAGNPIEGAGLAVYPPGEVDATLTRSKPQAKSGADGRISFTYPVVEGQTATVLVSSKGRVCLRLNLRPVGAEVDGKKVSLCDQGDLILPEGFDATGLIRDEEGKPIAGAEASASDILSKMFARTSNGQPTSYLHSRATSDERGILRLVGMPKTGVDVRVAAQGYYSKRIPFVNRHVPLVATLTKGGQISGKVVDAAGKPVAKARLQVYSEAASSHNNESTGDDGAFQVSVPGPGRYRIRYYGKLDGASSYTFGWSKLLEGPQQDLVLSFGAGDPAAAKPQAGLRAVKIAPKAAAEVSTKGLIVRVTDKKTGIAPKKVQATVLWWPANQFEHNRGYLQRQLQDVKIDEQGRIKLSKPGRGAPPTGRVLVVAKGYAPVTIKDVEWNDEAKTNEVVVKLEPESVIEGSIVDQDGKPVEGAKILAIQDPLAMRNYRPAPMRRKLTDLYQSNASKLPASDEKGSFRLESLGRGSHFLYLSHPKFADAEPKEVELKVGVNKVQLTLPKGATLFGKLAGVKVKPGWQIRIQRMPEPQNNMGGSYYSLNADQASEFVPVAEDGSFAIEGLTRANYDLSLNLPSVQGKLEIPVGPFRIRSKDLHREFEIAEEMPGTLTGTAMVRGAPLAPGRLILVATERAAQSNVHYSNRPNYLGHSVMVGAGGKFEIDLPGGTYNLRLVDLATGVVLYQGEKSVRVKSTESKAIQVVAKLAPVTVSLVPEKEGGKVSINRVEIRVTHPPLPGTPQNNMVFGGNVDQYRGIGIEIEPGQTEVQLVLPCVPTKLLVRSDAHNLDPQVNSYNFPPQGEVELDPKTGESNRVEIRVVEPELNLDEAAKK